METYILFCSFVLVGLMTFNKVKIQSGAFKHIEIGREETYTLFRIIEILFSLYGVWVVPKMESLLPPEFQRRYEH